MRVLHLTRDYPPRINGGISVAVGGLVPALERAGVECHVLSFDGWRPSRRRAAPTRPLTRAGRVARLADGSQLEAACALVETLACDVTHVHHPLLWRHAPASSARVFHVHVHLGALDALRGVTTDSGRAEAEALATADAVIKPATWVGTRGEVIGFGVDATSPNPPVERDAATVLYAGRLGDVKGSRELLEAWRDVSAARPEAKLVIAGGLPDNPKAERRWRRRFAEAGQVEVTGWLPREQLWRRMAQATLLVAPSWHETFALAVREAMLLGTPVVVGEVLGELVGDAGLVVPPRAASTLAAALLRLLSDSALRRRLGDHAEAALGALSWDEPARRVVDLYQRVTATAE